TSIGIRFPTGVGQRYCVADRRYRPGCGPTCNHCTRVVPSTSAHRVPTAIHDRRRRPAPQPRTRHGSGHRRTAGTEAPAPCDKPAVGDRPVLESAPPVRGRHAPGTRRRASADPPRRPRCTQAPRGGCPTHAGVHMLSTMQDAPLSIAQLLRYGSTVHSQAQVVTWTEQGPRTATYGEVGRRCARLAHALRKLGITGDERVGTFMWNNQEHLEAYLAVPAMGAVLHTLNIRLFPDQLIHVVNHAEDQVILVDDTLLPLLAPHLRDFKTVRHLVVRGDRVPEADIPDSVTVHSWEQLIGGEPEEFDW